MESNKIKQKLVSGMKRFVPVIYDGYLKLKTIDSKQLMATRERIKHYNQEPVYVFWTHDALLKYHTISQCILAKTLQSRGHRVLMIHCKGELSRCTIMDGVNLPHALQSKSRERLCMECRQSGLSHFKSYQLPYISLSELVSVDDLNALTKAMNKHDQPISTFEFDDIGFGMIGLGEIVRQHKLCTTENLSKEQLILVREHAYSSALQYLALKALRVLTPIARVTFFGDYGNVLGVVKGCMRSKIPVTNLSHALLTDVQRHKITMMGPLSTNDQFWRLEQWPKWKDIPLPKATVKAIANDVMFRFTGTGFTLYSPSKTNDSHALLKKLNIDSSKKLIVAYTSSLDEALSTQIQYSGIKVKNIPSQGPFKSQIAWLKQLVDFVERSDNYHLVVRIHPREAFDVYEKKTSEHLKQLREALGGEYNNATVIWPEDKTSSYDLGELAHLVLIAWTSVGLELGRLGVPVLAAFPYCPYPYNTFVHWANEPQSYFSLIERLCTTTQTLDTIKAAFRWHHIARFSHAVDVHDMAPEHDFTQLPPFKLPQHTKFIESVLVDGAHASELTMQNLDSTKHEQEEDALKQSLRAMILKLLNISDSQDYLIKVQQDKGFDIHLNHDVMQVMIHGDTIRINYKGQTQERHSPMIKRLILLSAQEFEKEHSCNTVNVA